MVGAKMAERHCVEKSLETCADEIIRVFIFIMCCIILETFYTVNLAFMIKVLYNDDIDKCID